MIRLLFASIANRRTVVFLTALSVALSVLLFASVEKLRNGARASFTHTISGTHIIAGARSGQIPLLLFSVFHLGSPTSNVSYSSFRKYRNHPAVAWALPLSIGDSHRGFRVIGTSSELMRYYRYRDGQPLQMAEGTFSLKRFKAVLGSTVARELGYKVGTPLVLTHGISDVQGIHDHEQSPFVVEGIFEPTGTPFDKGIYISLESAELMHDENHEPDENLAEQRPIRVEKITSFLIGVKQPVDILPLVRAINEDRDEPLTAILPGVVLSEIWHMMGFAENILRVVSYLVMTTALCGLFIALYASLAERYREMAILRALGAHPFSIAALLIAESLLVTAGGMVLGYLLLWLLTLILKSTLLRYFSVTTAVWPITSQEALFLSILVLMSFLVALLPAYLVYRRALIEGLRIRS